MSAELLIFQHFLQVVIKDAVEEGREIIREQLFYTMEAENRKRRCTFFQFSGLKHQDKR